MAIEAQTISYVNVTVDCDTCKAPLRNPDIRSCCEDDCWFSSTESAMSEAHDADWQVSDGVVTCAQCLGKAECEAAGDHAWSPWTDWLVGCGRGRYCTRECGAYERQERPALSLVD